jgi:hypothetical protein
VEGYEFGGARLVAGNGAIKGSMQKIHVEEFGPSSVIQSNVANGVEIKITCHQFLQKDLPMWTVL